MSSDRPARVRKQTLQPGLTRAAATRAEILAAAARLFAEKGYTDCNLRELAERVGMKPGSFYYHFRSKEEILDALLDTSIQLISDAVRGAVAAADPEASVLSRLEAAMRAHITTFLTEADNSTAVMRVWEYLPPILKRRKRESRRAYAQIWYDLMEQGIREGVVRDDIELRVLVPFVLTGMNRAIEWFQPGRMSIAEVCDAAVRINLEGGILRPGTARAAPRR